MSEPLSGELRREPWPRPRPRAARRPPTQAPWSFEELRSLAIQLQIRDAEHKSRAELVELLRPAAPSQSL